MGNFARATNSFWIVVIRTRTFEVKCPDTPVRMAAEVIHLSGVKIRLSASIVRGIGFIIRAASIKIRYFHGSLLAFLLGKG